MSKTPLALVVGLVIAAAFAQPTAPPPNLAAPGPQFDQGDDRLELLVVYEQRFNFLQQFVDNPPASALHFRFRLQGESIGSLVRIGDLVLTVVEAEDGESLMDPNATPSDETRPLAQAPEQLVRNGWQLPAQLPPSPRDVSELSKVEGYVNVVFAEETEDVVVINPLQFRDKDVEHPRLSALGVEVAMEANAGAPGDPAGEVRLTWKAGADKVRTVQFVDEWLRPQRVRGAGQENDADGNLVQRYLAAGEAFTEKTQMVITLFPNPRAEKVAFSLNDIALP